jgi:putative transcriptional regulator
MKGVSTSLDKKSSKPHIRRVVRSTAQGRRNRVRSARQGLGLTQAQLAEAVGVSRQTVVAIEAGDYAPSVYLALGLAAVLGASVEELFGSQDGEG